MARYSVELRSVVEAGINIFNFPYPFYDETKRKEFEQNFIRHFYFREIGAETVDRFRFYLQDKMMTVFPYYNKLLEASQIDYNVLDNYNIKEEYTIERDTKGKTAGVSSSVGRVEDNQSNEASENVNVDGSINTTNDSEHTSTETGLGTTNESGNETSNKSTTANGSAETNKESTVNNVAEMSNIKKFLDTPQGKVDLATTDYLTNLTQDEGGSQSEATTNEKNTSTDSKTGAEEGEVNRTGSSETETSKNVEGSESQVGKTTSSDKTDRTANSKFVGDQKSTQDSNTRSETSSEQVEKSVYTKKGNIGVDTDADMIQKHILLQKTLMNIQRMFFDECEDLFMLVY